MGREEGEEIEEERGKKMEKERKWEEKNREEKRREGEEEGEGEGKEKETSSTRLGKRGKRSSSKQWTPRAGSHLKCSQWILSHYNLIDIVPLRMWTFAPFTLSSLGMNW